MRDTDHITGIMDKLFDKFIDMKDRSCYDAVLGQREPLAQPEQI